VRAFSLPPEKEGEQPKPLEHLEAAILTPGGSVLVSDEDKKRVYRFDGQSAYKGPFPDAKERRVSRMLIDGEGAIVWLDREARVVQVLNEAGVVARTIGPRGAGFELRKPVDLAVDPFRNVYVAEEEGGVLVFSPQGQLLATIGAADLRRPRAIALDAAGALLVYDDRLQRVARFK
jgi:sugar lactone lactonase YvrE